MKKARLKPQVKVETRNMNNIQGPLYHPNNSAKLNFTIKQSSSCWKYLLDFCCFYETNMWKQLLWKEKSFLWSFTVIGLLIKVPLVSLMQEVKYYFEI